MKILPSLQNTARVTFPMPEQQEHLSEQDLQRFTSGVILTNIWGCCFFFKKNSLACNSSFSFPSQLLVHLSAPVAAVIRLIEILSLTAIQIRRDVSPATPPLLLFLRKGKLVYIENHLGGCLSGHQTLPSITESLSLPPLHDSTIKMTY